MRIGPESGTARRLVRTPITDTSPKLAATIGVVALCAARETESSFERACGGFAEGSEQRPLYESLQRLSKEQYAEDRRDGELEAGVVDEEGVVGEDGG